MADAPPDKVTPMLRQYLDLKSRYADALLLFQMGDFYETSQDTEKTAAALNIALTSRSRADAERIPMAGFPIHAARVISANCWRRASRWWSATRPRTRPRPRVWCAGR